MRSLNRHRLHHSTCRRWHHRTLTNRRSRRLRSHNTPGLFRKSLLEIFQLLHGRTLLIRTTVRIQRSRDTGLTVSSQLHQPA